MNVFDFIGADKKIRTSDLRITNVQARVLTASHTAPSIF